MSAQRRGSRGDAPGRPYTVRDQVGLRRLTGVAASSDGTRIVLRITTSAPRRNELTSRLWTIEEGGGVRALTPPGGDDANPLVSPDGTFAYYIAGRKDHRQVMRIGLDGGRPTRITDAPVGVDSFVLSRDGGRIAFAAMVYPGVGDTLAATAERLRDDRRRRSTGHLHERLFIRHWDEWKTGRRRHVFVQDVEGGRAIDVMPEVDDDSPVKPFGGREQLSFPPDGKAVLFTMRDAGREEAWTTDLHLFVAPVDGSAAPRAITRGFRGTGAEPTFSPDGARVAYLATNRPGCEYDRQVVVVRNWPDGKPRRLSEDWDRSADSIAWASDGRSLFVTADDEGQTALFAVDAATGAVTPIHSQGHVANVTPVDGRVLFTVDSLAGPADLHEHADGRTRRLTSLNDRRLRSVVLGEAEAFTFAGWNDEVVHAYLVKPAGFRPDRKYPVAFIVHGGPQSSMGNAWGYRWNPQVYAGAGYAAVMIDFHGSTGYGQAFTDSIMGDWGGKPLEDLQKGWAAALARYPFLDASRASALGASFGGFMINLIAGIWNEPWRCLVAHAGNLDERFAYYATEELWFPEWDHGGTPWDNPAGYERHNPVDHVGAWRLPMLVIHGALDFRVTAIEGMATFTALQRRGIPSQLLYFPDENHWISKPGNSVQWHDTVLAWLDRWSA